MLKYADILSSCFAHQECRQKDVERLLKSHGSMAYDPLEILVIFSVRENMSLTNNSKLILGVNDLLHVSLHHLSKGGVFVIAKRRLYSI